MPGPSAPEQSINTGLPTVEQRMQTMKNLAANFKIPVPERFQNDPHFWYLASRDYWIQRNRIPKTLKLKPVRQSDLTSSEPAALVEPVTSELEESSISDTEKKTEPVIPKIYLGNIRELAITNAVEQASKYALLEKEAATDNLTGIFNRRALDRYLMNLLRTRHPGEMDALVMFDMDNFKGINDEYNHTVGDATLKEMVRLIQEDLHLRGIDFLARYGGEEFFLVIPGIDTKQEGWNEKTMKQIDSIRDRISIMLRSRVEAATNKRIKRPITASFGLVFIDEHTTIPNEQDLEGVYKLVGERLSEAKKSGKDVVVGPRGPYGRIIKEAEKNDSRYMAGVFNLMPEGIPATVNPYLLELLGYEEHVSDLSKLGFDPDLYKKLIDQMGEDEIIGRVETRFVSKDGNSIPVMVTGIKTENQGQNGLLCVVQTFISDENKNRLPRQNAEISSCANCTAIRGGGGDYIKTQIPKDSFDAILSSRGIKSTHGICHPCSRVLYSELYDEPAKENPQN